MKRVILTAAGLAVLAAVAFGAQIFAAIGTPEERLDVLEPQVADLQERVLTLEGKTNTYTGSIGSEATAPRTNIHVVEHTSATNIFGATITVILRSDDPSAVRFIEVTAVVRIADDGKLLAAESGFADKQIVLPGETSTFTILVLSDEIEEPSSFGDGLGKPFTYELEITGAQRYTE